MTRPPKPPPGLLPAARAFVARWWKNRDTEVERVAAAAPPDRRAELAAYLLRLRAWLAGDLERVVSAFSDGWREARAAADRPRIEDVLRAECRPNQPPAKRPRVFAALLVSELRLRGHRGDLPTPDEYLRRFAAPEYADCRRRIPDCFERCNQEFAWRFRVTPRLVNGRAAGELVLGEGGQAVVVLGRDTQLDRHLAIKRAKEDAAATGVQLLRREAKTLARLTDTDLAASAGVPVPYGFGFDTRGRLCLALRLIRQENNRDPRLSARIAEFHAAGGKPNRHDPRFAALIEQFARVCRTVHAAHAHPFRILHRDLKPSNVLTDDAGRPFVIDWGLALWRDDTAVRAACGDDGGGEMTARTVGGGTDGFMSPEQARDEFDRLDVASDVFNLGACLFQLMTGRKVYDCGRPWWAFGFTVARPAPAALLRARAREYARAPHPRAAHPAADRELGDIVRKAVAPHPADRYPSAALLADALDDWRTDRPQRTPTGVGWVRRRGYAVGRFARRFAVPLLLLFALLLLAAGGVWGAVTLWANTSADARRSDEARQTADAKYHELCGFADALKDVPADRRGELPARLRDRLKEYLNAVRECRRLAPNDPANEQLERNAADAQRRVDQLSGDVTDP